MHKDEDSTVLDAAAGWYVRRDAGPLDPEEEAQFREWMTHPANREAFETIAGTWDDLGRIARPPLSIVPGSERRSVSRRTARPQSQPLRRWMLAAAAAVVAVFVTGYALDLPLWLEADAMTATGEIRTVELADGSRIDLNTASAVAIDYSPAMRRIRLLRGEAVFTVAKNPSRPFVVDAAFGETIARGTVFSVRKESDTAMVAVLESRVGVSYPAATRAVELSSGQAVGYSRTGLTDVRPVDADMTTAWRRGKLIVVDRPLGDVIAELNRYHSGLIQITDASIRSQPVSGVFDIRDPVRVLDAVEQTLGLRSTRMSGYLILLHR